MLEVKDLFVALGNKNIVNGIALKVPHKSIVGLVGESGSGKTISAMAIAGLLDSQMKTSGQIILEGTEISNLNYKERGRFNGSKIAFIFQEPMTSLNPLMKVGKQIEEVLKLHSDISKDDRKARVLEIMKEVELAEPSKLYDKYPSELSGGMRQRVVIAMAAVLKPSLIIADEPTTALDADTGRAILKLIKDINEKYGSKVLIISHDLNAIKSMCSYVYVMKDGELVENGTTKEIFEAPKNQYTKSLIEAIQKREKQIKVKGTENILEVKEVSLFYREKKGINVIAENINFSIKKGEILGLLGKSGCGKSTLSRAIAGLNKRYKGEIKYYGEGEEKIQMVFQDPYSSLNPSKTIGFILSEPLKNQGKLTREEIKKEVLNILKQVELPEEFYNRYPHELSGGQRQRVSIGIALIAKPKLIIADEPVSALDVTVQKQILELFLKVQKETNISILMISHDIQVLNQVCDRIIKWCEIGK